MLRRLQLSIAWPIGLILLGPAVVRSQTPTVRSVVNSFSLLPSLAPGSGAAILGANLAPGSVIDSCPPASSGMMAFSCKGVSVTFGARPAAMYSTSSTALVVQVPVELKPGKVDVVVRVQSGQSTAESAPMSVTLTQYAPAVYVNYMFATGSAFAIRAVGSFGQITAANPATPGDPVEIVATGLGPTNPALPTGALGSIKPIVSVIGPIHVRLGDRAATVEGNMVSNAYSISGPDCMIVFKIPDDVPNGQVPLIIEVGGEKSQPGVTLSVSNPAFPKITSVSNAASGSDSIAANSWVGIYGARLALATRTWTAADFNGAKLPLVLEGVTVKVNGLPAAVYSVSPSQINVLAPADATWGDVTVEVSSSLGTAFGTARLGPYSPALFLFNADNQRYLAAVHADGTYVGRSNLFAGAAVAPAKPGETILLFGTGFGPTNPPLPADQVVSAPAALADRATLTVTIGGLVARVEYAGMTAAGQCQFNVVIPYLPDGDHPVLASIGGVQTQAAKYLTIRNP